MPIHQRASEVLSRPRLGFAGQIVEDPRNVKHDFVNLDGSTEQISTITIAGTVAGSDAIGLTLAPVGDAAAPAYDFEFTTTAGATTATLASNEMVTAWNADPLATAFGWATQGAGATVVITAFKEGAEFAFSVADASAGVPTATPAATQAAADPGEIPFGRFVLRASRSTTSYLVGADRATRIGEVLGQPCTVANKPTALTDSEILGCVQYRPSEQDTNILGTAATAVQPGEEGGALEEGKILVAYAGAQPAVTDTVYIGFAVGEEGKVYNASGTNRLAFARAKFLGEGADGLTYLWLRAN